MYDDPTAGQPPSQPPEPVDGAVAATPELIRSQLPGWERATTDPVCPFLRGVTADGALGDPIETPDPANRCVALHDAVPQSFRQQELVCLSSAHVNCPRYLRGSVGLPAGSAGPATPVEPVTAARRVTPATAGALALFGLAFLVSVGFVVATGGLSLTAAVPTATPGGAVLGEIETAPPTVVATPEPTAVPTPTPSPTPVMTPSPTPVVTPSPSPTPAPTTKATPRPTSNRFALLKPCPGTSGCYIYIVRRGDNLFSIARYFGVPLKTVQAMNPWTRSGLVAGHELRIPTPTR